MEHGEKRMPDVGVSSRPLDFCYRPVQCHTCIEIKLAIDHGLSISQK